MLKKVLYVILFLIVTYLVLCLLGPKKMEVTTTKTIHASPSAVYSQIGDLRNMKNWSKWILEDTAMKLTYGKTTSGIGGTYSWDSKESGTGTMTITATEPDKMLAYALQFKGWDVVSDVKMDLKPNGNATDVTWSMVAQKESPFFLRGFMFVMNMNGSIKKAFDKGLENLDNFLKNNPNAVLMNGFYINEGKFTGGDYLTKRQMVKFADMQSFYATHLPAMAKLAGSEVKGAPSGIYWMYDEKNMMADMAAAMPVSNKNLKDSTYSVISVPEKKELLLDYYGNYDNMKNAYAMLDSLGRKRGYTSNPEMVVEEYITDPMTEKDTTKWLTRIHYMVK